MGAAFMYFMDNNYAATLQLLETVEVVSEVEASFAYPLASMSALKLGDLQAARDFIVRANPILASDTVDSVDKRNVKSAILLAYVLKRLGDDKHADRLLAQAQSVVDSLPRIGVKGHGISDVHIFAIQGRRDAAIEALRDAIDEGFVSLMSYDFWTLNQDPIVDDLRNDSRFKAMQQELNQRIEAMRKNVERAEQRDDWSELLGKVRGEQLTAALHAN
jgi:hypothetical protein